MATSGDDDVIENMNTSNEGRSSEVIELNDVPDNKTDLKEINGGNSHSKLDENMASSGHVKQDSESKPLLPKIFIALLVVLLIAVIALSFVLYHLDQNVGDNEDEVKKASQSTTKFKSGLKKAQTEIDQLQKENEDMQKTIIELTKKKDLSKNVTAILTTQKEHGEKIAAAEQHITEAADKLTQSITSIDNKIQKHNKSIADIKKNVEKNSGTLTEHKTLITEVNHALNGLKNDTTLLNGEVTDLRKNVTLLKNNILKSVTARIAVLDGLQQDNKKSIANHTKELEGLREFQYQLHLDMHYREVQDKINISYKEVLDLIGKKDIVNEDSTVLTRLVKQVKEFEQVEKTLKLGITYQDVLNLTDGDVLKGDKDLQTVKKIVMLYDMFTPYQSIWDITFKEVIRLTTKEDIKGIIVKGLTDVPNGLPPVLQKINYLYNVFNTTYRKDWGIDFHDVIFLTKSLNFKVGDTNIPVLQLISTWYVPHFNDTWGHSFKEFFRIMKDNENQRKELLAQINGVAETEKFLRFRQATFVYENKALSVYGYIEVFLTNLWGTIWNKNNFENGPAKVLCLQGGYQEAKGRYDGGIYNTGSVKRNLTCLVSKLQCFGSEKKVQACPHLEIITNTNITWNHKEDLGIKCTFK